MRIGIDIRSLQNDSRDRGIGTYSRCLIKALLSSDKKNEYVFFTFNNQPLPDILKEAPFRHVKVRGVTARRKRFVWVTGQARFPFATAKEKLDIFHSLEYIVAVFSRSRKVITVHDFINKEFEAYKRRNGILRKTYFYLIDRTLERADKIIAVSEYTKQKIISSLKVKEDKVKVVYQGVDEGFRPLADKLCAEQVLKKYNIHNDFFLYVGVIDYHKNIDGLIRAFSRMKSKEAQLVLAGTKNDLKYLAHVEGLISKLNLKLRVHLLGFVPKDDLVILNNAAKAAVSVSFYEGFGLPVLEAMSCAKAVIASGNTSMREIVRDAGILVDPYNTEEITHAMDRLLSDNQLNAALAAKCYKRSKQFSWDKAASETLGVYKELA
jgi:glycosyltransferase involved in cell wall biosynthesis